MKRAALTPSLYAPDLQATLAFYVDVLGFQQTGGYEDPPIWAELTRGEARIWLFSHALDDHPAPTFSGLLYVFVDDVDAMAQTLEGRADIRWGPDTQDYGLRELGIADPNGYLIVFAQDV